MDWFEEESERKLMKERRRDAIDYWRNHWRHSLEVHEFYSGLRRVLIGAGAFAALVGISAFGYINSENVSKKIDEFVTELNTADVRATVPPDAKEFWGTGSFGYEIGGFHHDEDRLVDRIMVYDKKGFVFDFERGEGSWNKFERVLLKYQAPER